MCSCVCPQWKVLIFTWNCYLATQTNKSNFFCRSSCFYLPQKQTTFLYIFDDEFLYTQQISYYSFFVCMFSLFNVHDVICMLCVCLTIYHDFLCGYLMHVFRCFARIFVKYRQTNCRSNSTANFFSALLLFFVRLQFDYKRSNFFPIEYHTFTHNIFSHFENFFAWLKKWPLTMCKLFFSLYAWDLCV